jgi:excisionase family DNA binding protein
MTEKLMTESELAKRLSISKSTLSMLRAKGELPFRLIGTCIRYEPDEVEAWLRGCGVNAAKGETEHERHE